MVASGGQGTTHAERGKGAGPVRTAPRTGPSPRAFGDGEDGDSVRRPVGSASFAGGGDHLRPPGHARAAGAGFFHGGFSRGQNRDSGAERVRQDNAAQIAPRAAGAAIGERDHGDQFAGGIFGSAAGSDRSGQDGGGERGRCLAVGALSGTRPQHPQLPWRLPVPFRPRADAGEAALWRRTQPFASCPPVSAAGQCARARRADQ